MLISLAWAFKRGCILASIANFCGKCCEMVYIELADIFANQSPSWPRNGAKCLLLVGLQTVKSCLRTVSGRFWASFFWMRRKSQLKYPFLQTSKPIHGRFHKSYGCKRSDQTDHKRNSDLNVGYELSHPPYGFLHTQMLLSNKMIRSKAK